jgi:hypothetical protein
LDWRLKNWKTNWIFLIGIWIVLLIASVTILESAVVPFLRNLQTQNLISLDWSGYSVASDNLFPQPVIVGVNASWTLPTVIVTAETAYSAAWIGIGGQSDQTLIQCGSEHDSRNGQAYYTLWYELIPDYAIPIPEITVNPGDKITAAISLIDSETNNWLIEISDVTVQQSFSLLVEYNSSRRTAEWIIERPTVNNQISTLANFGSVTFTDAIVQVIDNVGTIKDFPNYQIIMQDRMNNQLVTISDLSMDGSSFTIYYGSP